MVTTTTGTSATQPPKRSRLPLVMIVIICLAPVVFALLAYYVPSLGLRPDNTNNYGTILDPQRPVPAGSALPLHTLENQPFNLNSLHGKWILISADQAACPESCVKKLFILRNSHASQGKNVERLSRVWFITDDGLPPDQVVAAYQGTHMLRADPAQLAAWLAPKATPEQIEQALAAPMWIVDPLGNLMMQFPEDADPISVRNDLSKLIKNSRIG